MKVVHAPTDLGMRAAALSAAERMLGHDSRVVVRRRGVHHSGAFVELYSRNPLVYAARLGRALTWMLRADVLMLNSGSSLLDFSRLNLDLVDLPLYSALRKRVVVTFQGCDVRMCGPCPVRPEVPSHETCVNVPVGMTYESFDAWKRRRLVKLKKRAGTLLAITPDLCRTDPAIRYSPHAKVLPDDARPVERSSFSGGPLRVAHMPKPHNHKGTSYVLEAVRQLRTTHDVEYISIEGMGWREALAAVASCDVVVDQVVTGWYGGISVEAALLGVPAIARIDSDLLQYVPADMAVDLPVIAIDHRERLHEKLAELADDRAQLAREAQRCHEAARRHHDAVRIARGILGG